MYLLIHELKEILLLFYSAAEAENIIFSGLHGFTFVLAAHVLQNFVFVERDSGAALREVAIRMQLMEDFFSRLELLALDHSLLTALHLESEGRALFGVGLRSVPAKSRVVLHLNAANLASHRSVGLLRRLRHSSGRLRRIGDAAVLGGKSFVRA